MARTTTQTAALYQPTQDDTQALLRTLMVYAVCGLLPAALKVFIVVSAGSASLLELGYMAAALLGVIEMTVVAAALITLSFILLWSSLMAIVFGLGRVFWFAARPALRIRVLWLQVRLAICQQLVRVQRALATKSLAERLVSLAQSKVVTDSQSRTERPTSSVSG